MALSSVHVLQSSTDPNSTTSYEYFRNEEIKRFENDPLRVSKTGPLGLVVDSIQHLAIGYGYDLEVRPAATSVAALTPYLAPGVTISQQQIAYLEAYRSNSVLNLPGDPLNGLIPARDQVRAAWINITLASEAQATALLNVSVAALEGELPQTLVATSQERAAVISNSYNLGSVPPRLYAALASGNRAEAWYEIRYNSNNGRSASIGIANRRYRESNLLGLYDAGPLNPDLAKQIVQMYTLHRWNIAQYEREYPPTADIHQTLGAADAFLTSQFGFAQGFVTPFDEVLAAKDYS